MNINYDHSQNSHTSEGPCAAFSQIFADYKPSSLLDIGCGTGTWLKAAIEHGVTNILGVDGIKVPLEQLLVSPDCLQQQDLTVPWNIGRRFDAVICLEVAEHLEAQFAEQLIKSITTHADFVVFSAAAPGQQGQHHVHCQWPEYWQKLFNSMGFVCSDAVRWRLWNDTRIEPWYRQNIFTAQFDPEGAGLEDRIKAAIHPDLLPSFQSSTWEFYIKQIENGVLPVKWYYVALIRAFISKITRHLRVN